MFINFWIFPPFFLCLSIKNSNYLAFKRGGHNYSRGFVYCFCQIFQELRLFKRLCLFRTLEYRACRTCLRELKMSPPDLKIFPRTCWSSSWTTQSMWRMGRGISFLLFSKQILDFFSYNQILGFFFYFANADITFLLIHFANSLTQLSYSPHRMFSLKSNLRKMKSRRNKSFHDCSLSQWHEIINTTYFVY